MDPSSRFSSHRSVDVYQRGRTAWTREPPKHEWTGDSGSEVDRFCDGDRDGDREELPMRSQVVVVTDNDEG